MIETQLTARGVTGPVLEAMGAVPREAFVDPEFASRAYADSALPIAADQTISQPYIVALMIEAAGVAPSMRVLEVGAGSGYAAAVMARIADRVFAIERHATLADAARRRLEDLGIENVEVRGGDGAAGWPEHAPVDAVRAAAAAPDVPAPLLDQLAIGGSLVMPVGGSDWQTLRKITRGVGERYEREALCDVRFVPLVSA